ncbi:cysteine desulfurase NifS [Fusobacterium pseudoperiodonticum]|uniref:Cysteine desulfurase n=1 Tax=Fusobacterium pseudoperiodonticum TaxID=2663009 RepID=A0AAD0AJK9_9FUSO|nr:MULTISPECIES: cysteine desulfurase NifS [Fusobacterium]ATV36554.1 cysteine desulfurase NifS [Fusobacterium pseudoperiodonticum]ATV60540.1 cysteine desulfurase NifS [Fusobacterium pseudoperiodonticum]MBF1204511.1 cysteine desulfurase NifS [Fusobacterium periodonticum]MBF1214265.1 cysteine desulfurase NifS [Fusobacterium periodonticum]VTX92571.1 Cysteine desulfurase NifS [Fusobacterium periodonticum]
MKVYLDNNATTKVDEEVVKAMMPYFSDYYGNPFSLHLFGNETGLAVTEARQTIADILKAKPSEIIFTASGSEADNLAIRGIAKAYKHRGKHIITSTIEHPAVKNTFIDLMEDGFEVTMVPVDENGVMILDEFKKALREDTILVSVMHANNEVGSFQPVEEIGKITKERKIIFHVDAVQTMGKVEIYPEKMGIDLLSFSGHKFHAPKGIGVLYKRDGIRFAKVITGGNQEGKRRPGTSNVPYIVGLAKALKMATENMKEEWVREETLRNYFEDEVSKRIPEIKINGKGARRLPGTSSITFKYLEGESMLLNLSLRGIAVSSGSACSSDSLQPSHVLLAMGVPAEYAHGTLRFSLSKYTTKEEIDYTIEALVEIIGKLRELSPLWKTFKDNKLTDTASF